MQTDINSGFPVLPGSAEALDRWGGKTKYLWTAYILSNSSAKNHQNQFKNVSKLQQAKGMNPFETQYSTTSIQRPFC